MNGFVDDTTTCRALKMGGASPRDHTYVVWSAVETKPEATAVANAVTAMINKDFTVLVSRDWRQELSGSNLNRCLPVDLLRNPLIEVR